MALLRHFLLLFTMTTLFPWVIGDTSAIADILVLNDATFTDKIKEKDTLWFVKFCVPWCKHCARADLVWEELGKAVDMEDGVEIGQVDCTMSKATCSKAGIRAYPTLKLFYDGEDHKTYTGKRELPELKKFAVEAALELTKGSVEEEEVMNV